MTDPPRLAEAALAHGVGAHVLAAHERGELALPASVRERLAVARVRGALHGRLLRRELSSVAPAVIAACGVAAVLIKGAALDRLRRDPRERSFADLDLVVPRDTLPAAVDALEALGYRPGAEPWRGYGERHGHEVALTRRLGAHALSCELHWRISDDRAADALDHARLRHGASPLDAVDRSVLVPADPMHLLALCVHLLHEPAKRLVWIEDIALLARRPDDEGWRDAFALADEVGLGWALHRGLDYAAHHLRLERARPRPPGPPPRWGPLRAGERLDGWVAFQAGRVPVPGWHRREGYLRSAARARLRSLW